MLKMKSFDLFKPSEYLLVNGVIECGNKAIQYSSADILEKVETDVYSYYLALATKHLETIQNLKLLSQGDKIYLFRTTGSVKKRL